MIINPSVLPYGNLTDVGSYRLHYCVAGSGTPTVLLDAGLGDWSLSLLDLQQRVAAFARVVIYDRAGYGWSEPGRQPRTSQQLADELYALLCNAELPAPYLLVGHSLAGWHLRLFAYQHPDLVAGMLWIDATPPDFHPRLEQIDPGFAAGAAQALQEHQAIARKARAGQLQVTEVEPFGVPPFLDDAAQATFFHLTLQPHYWETLLAEWDAEAVSRTQVQAVTSLGDLPLTLLVAIPGADYTDQFRQLWLAEQQAQAGLSTQSAVIQVASNHHIHWAQPAFVVANIRRMVAAMDNSRPTYAEISHKLPA